MTKYAVLAWEYTEASKESVMIMRVLIVDRSIGYLDSLADKGILGKINLLHKDEFFKYEEEFKGELYDTAREPFIVSPFSTPYSRSAIVEVLDENRLTKYEEKLHERYGINIILIADKD